MNREMICSFFKENQIPFREKENMAQYTTFKIGGDADFLAEATCEAQVLKVYEFCKNSSIPLTVLGKGSNVLVSDDGIEGIVLLTAGLDDITFDGNTVTCGAGLNLITLCTLAQQKGLSGLEFAFGIPGAVGGAVIMNAGAYGGEIKDVIESVRYIDADGLIKTIGKDEMQLGYRTSLFKQKGLIILSASFVLQSDNKDNIMAKMSDFMSRRKAKQPLEFPSAGSTFKRPEGYFAGALIEENSLKGYSVGGAMVSEKHAGFVINYKDATAKDVKDLISHVQATVKQNNGVTLEREVIYLGRE